MAKSSKKAKAKKAYIDYLVKVYNRSVLGDNIILYDGEVYLHPVWVFDNDRITMTTHHKNHTSTIVFYDHGDFDRDSDITKRLKVLQEVRLDD